jgi:hypothetical protein
VDLDDPIYERLARLRALDRLPPYTGGLRPLTRARLWRLLAEANELAPARLEPAADGAAWIAPLQRVALRSLLFRDQARPYSTDERPRNLAGSLAISCEHELGRPCGDGLGLATELESAAGHGPWLAGVVRLRGTVGTGDHEARLEIDRAYVNAELGPVAVEAGRDILVLGPSSRTQLGWGTNAPPLDQVRLSTAEPFDLAGPDGAVLRGNLLYVVGQLREPQTFPGNLVTVARGQLDLFDRLELGMMQLLQLGGEGAASIGLLDFVAEHVRRRDPSAGPNDSSNRRLSFDLAAQVPALLGARLYYELAFEDLREAFDDAVRYDADHLVGAELAAIGPGRRHGLVVELLRTGVRSHEHVPRTTGFTHAGRLAGSPLGPDASAVYAGGRLSLGWGTIFPWAELARLSSDTYTFVADGGIAPATRGTSELRYRGGGRVRVRLRDSLRLEVEAQVEHVERAEFEAGRRDQNFGVAAQLVWYPEAPLGPPVVGSRR